MFTHIGGVGLKSDAKDFGARFVVEKYIRVAVAAIHGASVSVSISYSLHYFGYFIPLPEKRWHLYFDYTLSVQPC